MYLSVLHAGSSECGLDGIFLFFLALSIISLTLLYLLIKQALLLFALKGN